MSSSSSIEWTDATWNPVTGCDRVSPGCDHCYALTLAKRLKAMGNPRYQVDGDERTSGPGFGVTLHRDQLALPLRWRKPRRVFVNSMSDLFHPDVPDQFVAAVVQVMTHGRRHTFQVLTKRPQRMAQMMRRFSWDCNGDSDLGTFTAEELGIDRSLNRYWNVAHWLPNVWLGTSIESDRYTFRANYLREAPAAVRFLSLEPLLGPLPSLDLTGIDWVIVGGESGPSARPMHPDWVREIRDRCLAASIPFFFKQWGAWAPVGAALGPSLYIAHDGTRTDDPWRDSPERDHLLGPGFQWATMAMVTRLGKHAAGRRLDGRTWDEMPKAAS